MAVVTKYTIAAYNPVTRTRPDAAVSEGRQRMLMSRAEIAAGTPAGSVIWFGRIPDTYLPVNSAYYYSGIAGLTDFDLGFPQRSAGGANMPACLVNGDDLSAAGWQTIYGHGSIVRTGNQVRLARTYAGYTGTTARLAPKFFEVIGTLNTEATAAGWIILNLRYSWV
jgi:hypothetical protein